MTAIQVGFAAWAHVEAMGHRSHWGRVSEEVIAGAAFLRVDEFALGGETPRATAFYPPSSIYCLTPCTEETARTNATPWSGRPAALEPGDVDIDGMHFHIDDEAFDR